MEIASVASIKQDKQCSFLAKKPLFLRNNGFFAQKSWNTNVYAKINANQNKKYGKDIPQSVFEINI